MQINNSTYIHFLRRIGLFLFVSICMASFYSIEAQIIFSTNSSFKYLKGSEASELQSDWMKPEFDDSGWATGVAPFRYGDGLGGTLLSDMQNSYTSVFLRNTFQFNNPESVDKVIFSVNYDDGFIIWINGEVVLEVNAPDSPLYNSVATALHESGSFEQYTLDLQDANLIYGINTIAVQGFNISLTSTDFYFDVMISSTSSLPEYSSGSGISFSEESGFYNTPFYLLLNTSGTDEKIVYTLDGSNPQNSITATVCDSATARIYIDPANTSGRARTPAVILRASITKDGYQPGKPRSRTFIFLESVKNQSYPGGEWPTGSINYQTIDLNVDSRVINNYNYSSLIEDAFLEIPSISVITDMDNLFNPAIGIYVNAWKDGVEWERECSVALINPDGEEGFDVNAGLRIRGGFSRSPEFAKHSFRLLFKEIYGDPKLNYPLFGDEGVDTYDNIDLRTAQNYAWSNGDSRNTMVKEVFSRDTQGEMGQPYTRSRYYHLYLNGMYWGLYQTQERSESDYAADYLGGDSDDYDVIKVEAGIYDINATDGNLLGWQDIYNKTQVGFSNNKNYFELEGKDETGNPIPGAKTLVDIDNLIDYMILIFYTGNMDGPVSEPLNNKQPNNFYAIYNRENHLNGFRFFCHDAEHSLLDVNDNRVSLENRPEDYRMVVNEFKEFHPQWLHYKLSFNSEYRLRFSDRAYEYLTNGGILTPEATLNRFNARADQIKTAIIAESARWGDARRDYSEPYTRDDNWIPELNKMRDNYFPFRTSVVIDQLKSAGLFTDLDSPGVNANEVPVKTPDHKFNESVSVTIINSGFIGDIYYTTDGTDPREIGGEISKRSILFDNNPFTVNSTTVLKTRLKYYEEWGPLKQVNFLKTDEDYSSLKVTELHYNPLDSIFENDTIEGKKFEFIEFKNTGSNSINLSGLVLDSAVYFEFPENEILHSNQFFVISSKTDKFYKHYGMETSGNYQGYFSNSGEEVLLHESNGTPVIHFIYDDVDPWPGLADGAGYSLVSVSGNPTEDPNMPSYWKNSIKINGSPFADELILESTNSLMAEDKAIAIFPNPTNDLLNIKITDSNPENKMIVEIYSTTGMLVYRGSHPLTITLSLRQLNLLPAFYIVKVSCKTFSTSHKIYLTQ